MADQRKSVEDTVFMDLIADDFMMATHAAESAKK